MSRSDYPEDWNVRRKEVYQRDRYTCQNCGREGGPNGDVELHAHHIVPKSSGGSDDLSNLKTLCKRCHEAVHTSANAPTLEEAVASRGFLTRFKAVVAFTLVYSLGIIIYGSAIQFLTGESLWILLAFVIPVYHASNAHSRVLGKDDA